MQRPRWNRALLIAILLAGAPVAAHSEDAAPSAAAEAEESAAAADTREALARLKEASDFLAGLKAYSFEAEFSYDAVQTTGQKLEFGGARQVLVRRPDRVRVLASDREGTQSTLYFDGKAISVALPSENAYVSIEKPGSLNDAIDYIVNHLETPMPFDDLVYENFYESASVGIKHGLIIGEETVGGVRCTHLAFSAEGRGIEVWIDAGDKPLIRRFVVDYDRARRPQFRAQILGWNLEPDARDAHFAFRPAAGAERLSVATASDLRKSIREEAAGGQP